MWQSLNNDSSKTSIILSIVTVVKNDPVRLSQTVNSLKDYYGNNQFEHVIVDGQSDIETLKIINELAINTNVKIVSDVDNGIYDAMNKGIRIASGRYILFLNCGDRMVATVKETFSWLSELSTDADIICFPYQIYDGVKLLMRLPQHNIKHKMPSSHQSMIFSKLFIGNNLYNQYYKVAADYDLYLSASCERVSMYKTSTPLTVIELEGYASKNPILAYREYVLIAAKRLSGRIRLIVLTKIIFRAVVVIGMKKILPYKLISFFKKQLL